MAEILKIDENALRRAVTLLKAGKPIGMPTETVYGLAGDAANEDAVLAIYRTKARPSFDPLIVHIAQGVSSTQDLCEMKLVSSSVLTPSVIAKVDRLIAAFWPGPLTLILPKHSSVSDLITSGLPMVGIRMPEHPGAQALLKSYGRPLAAPSANRFGRISPTSAEDVQSELGDLIELILDGGHCDRGVESTVIGVASDGGFNLLRPGSLPIESIESVLGDTLRVPDAASSAASPGTLASHYAPGKKCYILPKPVIEMRALDWNVLPDVANKRVGLLVPCGHVSLENLQSLPFQVTEVCELAPTGDEREASRSLFRSLRALDASACDVILCEPVQRDQGLWIAVKDRLRRASQRL